MVVGVNRSLDMGARLVAYAVELVYRLIYNKKGDLV